MRDKEEGGRLGTKKHNVKCSLFSSPGRWQNRWKKVEEMIACVEEYWCDGEECWSCLVWSTGGEEWRCGCKCASTLSIQFPQQLINLRNALKFSRDSTQNHRAINLHSAENLLDNLTQIKKSQIFPKITDSFKNHRYFKKCRISKRKKIRVNCNFF